MIRAARRNLKVSKERTAILSGFWRRKETYGTLKIGDWIEAGVRNETTGTDVLSVIEGVRKLDKDSESSRERSDKEPKEVSEKGLPDRHAWI